jgi:hypothetical protein
MNIDLEVIGARLSAIEARLARLEASNAYPVPIYKGTTAYDCSCPPNVYCMNTACPRQMRVTCEMRSADKEGGQ